MEKSRKRRLRLWLIPVLVVIAYFTASTGALFVMGGDSSRGARADCIFVPGTASEKPGKPELGLLARLERALELFQAGQAPLIVVSGGDRGGANESEIMAAWLKEHGVPEAAILREDKSRSTRQNAVLSAPLMKARGIKRALIVSQNLHLARVQICLNDEDIETINAPCKGPEGIAAAWPLAREAFLLPIHAARADRWFQ